MSIDTFTLATGGAFTTALGASVLDDFTATTVATLRCLTEDANAADGHHAVQADGYLYGDLHTATRNLLRYALGDDEITAEVMGHLLDQYRPTATDVHGTVAYVMEQRAEVAAVAAGRCALHRAYDADYCPSCGTARRIGA